MKLKDLILISTQLVKIGIKSSWVKAVLVLFILLFLTNAYSQNQANVWYFGDGAGLNFNSNPPAQLEDGNAGLLTFTGEGVGSISDANGNLLFYTNGNIIYTRTHVAMPNGTGLNGNGTTTQTGLILPINGSTDRYFVISTSDGIAVKFVIVNMTLNGGLGDVEVASLNSGNGTQLLASPKAEGALVIPEYTAGNVPTNEYWILFHSISTNDYFVFKTSGGAINSVSTQPAGFAPPGQPVMIMKTNSCFNKIATSFYNAGRVEVLPFNNITGIISTPTLILAGTGGNPFLNQETYGAEFSPSGQFLYVSESGLNGRKTIYQFDITAGAGTNPAAVLATKSFFTGAAEVVRFGALQLGPDGKIYVPGYNTTTPCYLSVVPNPDVAWSTPTPTATQFQYLKYVYNLKKVGEGLPPVLKNLLTAVRIFYNNACEGGTTNFSYVFGGAATSTSWDFGDPASGASNTSSSLAPSHTYATAGTYTATLTIVDNCGRTRTGSVNVIVKTGPIVSVPSTLCASTNITLTGTGSNAANYTWSLSPTMSSPTGPSSTYVYNGALPTTVYVQDPTPLASYTTGNNTASQNFGADIGHTYFELFTTASISSFQVTARINGQTATFTIKSEDLTTTYYTVNSVSSVTGTTYTFNPNVTLSPGRYVLFTSNVNYAYRNNSDDDGNRDVSGVIDVLGEKNGAKGGSFINIGVSLPDPCGIKAIPLVANCPAPVTLLSFNGQKSEKSNLLHWNVANELNNSHFLVQRSADGSSFLTIGKVMGRGTAEYGEYSFVDQSPLTDKNYYRLQQVDIDGTYTNSKTILIAGEIFTGVVYPNPFSNQITVQSDHDAPLTLDVIDITGRMIYSTIKSVEQNEMSFGESLNKGTYLLRITSSEKVYILKIIKE
ncbi:MAG: T9SS type A sorting domain-containing protein [Cytophagaceae bacterium]|nr:T9SS type A sorting domain-containing protein [Cytophagaceae bacterium]